MELYIIATIVVTIAFVTTLLVGKLLIPFLKRINFDQPINDVGPTWHDKKKGTPTLGGLMFIVGILIAAVLGYLFFGLKIEENNYGIQGLNIVKLFSGICLALFCALVGFMDDYIKVAKGKNRSGLSEKQKTIVQIIIICVYLLSIYISRDRSTAVYIPFLGYIDFGWFYYAFAVFTIYSTINAVNITDGIDGLCSMITVIASVGFLVASIILKNKYMLILSCAALGGCLGFFMWNKPPAKVFMGDTGSMFLGGIISAIAFGINQPFLIIFFGIAYLIDILTVLIQRVYYKRTKKRIFKMTPIHHSFEISGYTENQIVIIFSGITLVGVILGLIVVAKIA